jgi:single-strand DNA-binding protein
MSETTSRYAYENKGNLVRDPELKSTTSGKLVARCAIAVHGKSRTEGTGEGASFTSFFDLEMWGETAENFAKSLKKGDFVEVKGDFSQQRWSDTEGKKRSAVKLIIQQFAKLARPARQTGENPA